MRNIQRLDLFNLPKGFRGRNALFVQLWWVVQGTLFSFSPQFMYVWRNWLLRLFGAKIGIGVKIRPTVKIVYPWKLSVSDYAWIGDDVTIYSLGEVDIGSHAVISQKSYLCAGSHNYKIKDFPIYADKISVGNQAWIGTDVFIAPGVTIGLGTVVGARSSVLHSLPAMYVCVGYPATPIKPRAPIPEAL